MKQPPIRVLLIEDNKGDARLVQAALENAVQASFDVLQVADLTQALSLLGKESVDVVLSDLSLPDAAGLESVTVLNQTAPDVPILVVTGTDDEEAGLAALRAGAQDYIPKSEANSQLLRRAIRYAIERKHVERRLAELAQFDSLTGLANRMLFREFLNKAVARAERQRKSVAVLLIDLDRFKMVNDTHGQRAGDRLLTEVAQRLATCVRKNDLIARLGGDEFAVIMDSVDDSDTVNGAAQRILNAVSRPFEYQSEKVYATTSIGIAVYPADADNTEGLLSSAHTAMAQAKERGKNTFQFFTMDMHIRAAKHLELEKTLRGAIERDEFVLHYQPQLDMRSGQVIGFEALVRWAHPERGLVGPIEFIDFCEESGLIVPLGNRLMRAVCRQQAAWRRAGLPPMRIAVNVAARQIQRRDLADTFRQILTETRAEPERLEIELTESSIQKDPELAGKTLKQFAEMGFGIALDDFGTGYSSLTHLRSFPVTKIKIDRSFVANLSSHQDDAAIVKAIISMAHSLRILTLAEGVETAEQLAFLKNHQCDAMQGFYFSKPLPAEEVTAELFARGLYDLDEGEEGDEGEARSLPISA